MIVTMHDYKCGCLVMNRKTGEPKRRTRDFEEHKKGDVIHRQKNTRKKLRKGTKCPKCGEAYVYNGTLDFICL